MLKTLIKKQLYYLNRGFFYDQKTGKRRSQAASVAMIALYVALMLFVGCALFGLMGVALGGALHEYGLDWLYFAMFGLIGVAFGVFGSVFNTFASLYQAQDNDLLLSLPIPVTMILITRLSGVYFMGAMFSGIAIVPGVVVYCIMVACTPGVILGGVLLFLICSLVVLVLSCALGWIVAQIYARIKRKSLLTVIASLLFIAAYYYIYFNASELLTGILEHVDDIGTAISGGAYPLYLLGRVGLGDPLAMGLWLAVTLALLALVWWILSRSFYRLATAPGKVARAAYRGERGTRVRSQSAALLGREGRRVASSATCLLNCYMGTLLMVVGAVALLIKGGDLVGSLAAVLEDETAARQLLSLLLCGLTCLLASMNPGPAASISLEGRSLWLVRSLPVTPWQVLSAKLRLHLLTTSLPALLCSVCVIIATRCSDILLALGMLLLPQAATVFTGMVFLALNLKRPNLTWVSEAAVVKRGLCVLLAMLIGMAYALVCVGLEMLAWVISPAGLTLLPALVLLMLVLATAGAAVPIYLWLKRRGCEIFAAL